MLLKITYLFIGLFPLLANAQEDHTPLSFDPPNPKEGYFWNNDRNAKWTKTKPKVYTDSIKKGYYANVEYLTFANKELMFVVYRNKNNKTDTVRTFKNGNGFLQHGMDTISIKNGKLNGRSAFYRLYVTNFPTIKNPEPDTIFAKDWQQTILTYNNNVLLNMYVYRKGILVYEEYYKNYDVFRNYMGNGHSQFIDSTRSYRANGRLRSIYTKKGGYKAFPK